MADDSDGATVGLPSRNNSKLKLKSAEFEPSVEPEASFKLFIQNVLNIHISYALNFVLVDHPLPPLIIGTSAVGKVCKTS